MIGHRRKARLNWFLRQLAEARLTISGTGFLLNGAPWAPYGLSDGHFELTQVGDEAADAAMGATLLRTVVRLYGTYGGGFQQDMQQEGQPGDLKPAYLTEIVRRLTASRAAGMRNGIAMDSNKGQGVEDSGGDDYFSGSIEGDRKWGVHIGTAEYLTENHGDLIDWFEPLVEPNSAVVANKEALWAKQEEFMTAILAIKPSMLFCIGPRDYSAGNIANCINPAWLEPESPFYGRVFMTCNFLSNLSTDAVQRVTRMSGLATARNTQTVPAWINQLATHPNDDADDAHLTATMALADAASGGPIYYNYWERVGVNGGTGDGLYYLSDSGDSESARLSHTNRIGVVGSHFSGIPYWTSAPVINTPPVVGELVDYTAGAATCRLTPTLTARVLVNGVDVGAAGSYLIQAGDIGLPVVIRQTATTAEGSANSDSDAVNAGAQTWAQTLAIGLNSPVPKSYNPTRPWRNLAHQARMIDNFTNNGLPTQKADGYPANGQECYVIFAEDTLGSAYSGNYAFAVDGDNVPSYASTGSLAGVSYSAGANRTTGTITGVDGSQNLILGWSGGGVVDADFGDLQLMQPGYSIDDPELFTPEFVSHAGRAEYFRTMDLQDINYNTDVTWTGSTAAGEGVFLKHPRSVAGCFEMIDALGARPWLCITPDADDDYIENLVADALPRVQTGHVMRLGYGNEPWNTGLQTYGISLRRALVAGEAFTGNTSLSQSSRRITSVSRTGTTVTVELAAAHGKSVGQSIYSHADAGGVIAHGVYTLASGTAGSTLVFETVASGSRTGTLDANGFGSFLYLDLANPLAAPYTGYGHNDGQDDYPPILAMKAHHEIQRLRVAYDHAVTLGLQSKLALVRDTYGLLHRVDQLGLARARQEYGDLDWFYANGGGFTYNYYLTPASPDGVTDADGMLAQLETSRAQLAEFTLKAINAQARFAGDSPTAGRQSVYEWGLHNHDVQDSTVGAVVQEVHRDDARTGTLLADTAKDMIDRGINLACYFTSGTEKNFAAVTQVGASWGLHEGAMVGPSAQVKDAFFTALRDESAEPEAIAGKTWGTIRLADVHELLYQPNDDLFTNGVEYLSGAYSGDPDDKAVVLDIDHRLPDPVYHVYVETAGSKTIALDACAWFTVGATIAMEIDGVEVDSAPIQQVNYNTTAPPEQLSATLTLTKGWHRVRIVLPAAPRGNYVALYRLRCS